MPTVSRHFAGLYSDFQKAAMERSRRRYLHSLPFPVFHAHIARLMASPALSLGGRVVDGCMKPAGLDQRCGSRCREVNSTGLDATTGRTDRRTVAMAAAPRRALPFLAAAAAAVVAASGLRFICRWQTCIVAGHAHPPPPSSF